MPIQSLEYFVCFILETWWEFLNDVEENCNEEKQKLTDGMWMVDMKTIIPQAVSSY